MWKPGKFGFLATFVQVTIIILFVLFVHYGRDAHAADPQNSQSVGLGGIDPLDNPIKDYYSMFRDVHVMLYIGFALFLAGLKQYSFSAIGLNMLLISLAVQLSLLVNGFWDIIVIGKAEIDIKSLIKAEFASLSVVVSLGSVLGRLSPLQLLVMSIFQVLISAANYLFASTYLKVHDVGGSVFLHAFGAFFGLSVSYMACSTTSSSRSFDNGEDIGKVANFFSSVGAAVLFTLWPSFNAILTTGDDRHRAVVNTFLALTSSCMTSIAVSSLMDSRNRFSLVQVRNGTLAGGVGIGACADMMIQPYGAIIIGWVCGALSTVSQKFFSPFLFRYTKIPDACSTSSIHGIPGVLGGLFSVYVTAVATEDNYGKSLYDQFPARAPVENSTELYDIHSYMRHVRPGDGRSSSTQALFQAAAIALTLLVAVFGGIATGSIVRHRFLEPSEDEDAFRDDKIWDFVVLQNQLPKSSRDFEGGKDVNPLV